jgi:hypothetical protein
MSRDILYTPGARSARPSQSFKGTGAAVLMGERSFRSGTFNQVRYRRTKNVLLATRILRKPQNSAEMGGEEIVDVR